MVFEIYDKWTNTPVLLTFAEKLTPISEIPFPAVTICPNNKLRKEKINFDEIYEMLNETEDSYSVNFVRIRRLVDALNMCGSKKLKEKFADILSKLYLKSEYLIYDSKILSRLLGVSTRRDDIIHRCEWGDLGLQNCYSQFRTVITNQGFCFTFNLLDFLELFDENQ